jgi:transcription initiation factor TFIIIB Brf1 subunit/transcription initiation factor TFIIB
MLQTVNGEQILGTTLPHSEFGEPSCCGCLNGIVRGEQADIVCNECEAVIRTVPASDLQRTFDEMELTLDVASERCPDCGAVHLAPGFSKLMAFVCDKCGEVVTLSVGR